MIVKIEIEISMSEFEPWAGAIDTFNKLEEMGLLDDLEGVLEEMYPEGIDAAELNALLWFESEWLFEMLGIQEEE